MSKVELLNVENHRDLKVITQRSEAFGDNVMYCQTFAEEFRSVQAHYPILFHQAGDDNSMIPIALFGLEKQENLFLNDKGWDARYIPLMVQRQPFFIGLHAQKTGQTPTPMVNIDLSSPRVNSEEGLRLFDDLGEQTDYLKRMIAMLDTIHQWNAFNKGFMDALQQHDLLEPVNFDITLASNQQGKLHGFYGIHEEKFRQLSASVLSELWEKRYLDGIYFALASIVNIGALAERKSMYKTT